MFTTPTLKSSYIFLHFFNEQVLPTIPKEQRTRVAHFLEKQGFKQQALAVSSDPEHRYAAISAGSFVIRPC